MEHGTPQQPLPWKELWQEEKDGPKERAVWAVLGINKDYEQRIRSGSSEEGVGRMLFQEEDRGMGRTRGEMVAARRDVSMMF